MTDLSVRTHLFLARHRIGLAVFLALFAAGALLLGQRLKLNDDYTDMLPMSDPAIAEQVKALQHIRQADRLFLDVQTTALEPEVLAQAVDRMHEALLAVPELSDLRCNFEGTDVREMLAQLQAELPTLFTSNDLRELEGRLQPAAIEQRLAWFKKTLGQPQGLTLQTALENDPVGLGDAAAMRLRALQAGAGDARIIAGRITSPDERHVLISARPGFRPSETGRSKQLLARVLQAAREVEGQFPPGTVRIAVTGAHRAALDNALMIQADSVRTSVIATVAMAVLMVAAYRRRWLSLLGLVPPLFGALGAILVFYLTGESVSAVALGCGSILIGVTVDYGICVLYRAEDAPGADRAQLARAMSQLAPTVMFGALTTMAAFLVMLVSPVSGQRQLGEFGAVGVALAAVFATVILPVFLPVNDGPLTPAHRDHEPIKIKIRKEELMEREKTLGAVGGYAPLPLTSALQRLFRWRERHTWGVLTLMALFGGLCGLGMLRLRFAGDLNRLNGETPATRRDEQVVQEVWGKALSLTTVVVGGAGREEALKDNERLYALLRELREKHVVESFSSVAPLLPSEAARRANLRDWRAFWTEARRFAVSNSLSEVSRKLGFRSNAFLPFLNRLGGAGELAATGPGSDSALERVLSDYCTEKTGRVSVCTLVKVKDNHGYQALRRAVLSRVPAALLLNKAAMADEIARVAKRGLPLFGVTVVAANAVLLWVFLGRLELVGIALLPMAAGVFWTLGILGLCGVPIDLSNFIFVVFVIGVGGDYSLFLLMAELEPLRGYASRTASMGGAVTLCALTTLFGVGVLALAHHPALFSIGITALLGISLSLLATLFLVPFCMEGVRRRAGRCAAPAAAGEGGSLMARAKRMRQLYRYQGPYVTQFVFWKMKTDPLFKAVEEAVPQQGRILDLGCGYGIVANWLTLGSPGRTVMGVDTDAGKVRVARATATRNLRICFEKADALAWEYPACDCVLLCDLLHYLPHALKEQVLRKAYAALRPGGWLVVRDAFAADNWRHRLTAWSEKWGVRLGQNQTAYGLHFESLNDHWELLARTGFREVQTRDDGGAGSNALLIARKARGER
jgi:predicted exporter/SAM-dependent methyltransferase